MAGNGKQVQFARGTREAEDAVTGLEGEVRVDLSRKELRLHDGQKQGGHRVASVEYVDSIINRQEGSSAGSIQMFATAAELKAFQPAPTILAVLREEGKEDSFVWQQGTSAPGDIPSDISGYWKRLDGEAGLAIQFFRAGIINLQIDGTEPAVSQGTTAWLVSDALKLWDGAAYVDANPATWMRLFATIGGYATGAFTLPDRLQAQAVDATNLDTITESGWYRSTVGATGNPVPSVNQVEHRELSSGVAIQTVSVPGDATRGYFIRYRTSIGPIVWTAFTYLEGEIPLRLRASQTTVADFNLMLESGFYRASVGHTNGPAAGVWSVVVIRLDGNNLAQFAIADAQTVSFRLRVAGAWLAWNALSRGDHLHDDRYYTEAEMDSLLAAKAAAAHTHDDRYYTESEVNSLLSSKAPLVIGFGGVGSYVCAPGSSFSGLNTDGMTGTLSGYSGTWRNHGFSGSNPSNVFLYQRVG